MQANMYKESCRLACAVIHSLYAMHKEFVITQGTSLHLFIACIVMFMPSANLSNAHRSPVLEQHLTLIDCLTVVKTPPPQLPCVANVGS